MTDYTIYQKGGNLWDDSNSHETGGTPSDILIYYHCSTGNHYGELDYIYYRISGLGFDDIRIRSAIYDSSSRAIITQSNELSVAPTGQYFYSSQWSGNTHIYPNSDYIIASWVGGDIFTERFGLQSQATESDVTIYFESAADYSAAGNGNFLQYVPELDDQSEYDVIPILLGSWTVYTDREQLSVTTNSGCIASGLTTATITGKVTGGSGTVWFLWDTEDFGEVTTTRFPENWSNSSNKGYFLSSNTFEEEVNSLDRLRDYYYRVYISLGNDYASSDVETFKTSGSFSPPKVSNPSGCMFSSNVEATITGKVIGGSGTAWFYWGTNDGGQVGENWSNSKKMDGIKYSGDFISSNVSISDTFEAERYYRIFLSSNYYEYWVDNSSYWSEATAFYPSGHIDIFDDDEIYIGTDGEEYFSSQNITGNFFTLSDYMTPEYDGYLDWGYAYISGAGASGLIARIGLYDYDVDVVSQTNVLYAPSGAHNIVISSQWSGNTYIKNDSIYCLVGWYTYSGERYKDASVDIWLTSGFSSYNKNYDFIASGNGDFQNCLPEINTSNGDLSIDENAAVIWSTYHAVNDSEKILGCNLGTDAGSKYINPERDVADDTGDRMYYYYTHTSGNNYSLVPISANLFLNATVSLENIAARVAIYDSSNKELITYSNLITYDYMHKNENSKVIQSVFDNQNIKLKPDYDYIVCLWMTSHVPI